MPNANFITQFEYKLNNLTGSETQAELLALRATSDKYVDDLNSGAVALLDAAIDADASALTNTSTIKELVTVGNADAEIKSGGGGTTPLGGVIMKVSSDIEFTDENDHRYLKSGYIDTDTTGLDPSVINYGTYKEDIGTANTSASFSSIVSTTGVIISHPASDYVARQENADTPQVLQRDVLGSTGSVVKCVATNNAGRWVVGGTGYPVYSDDDGLTWQSCTGDSRHLSQLEYCRLTGMWVGISYSSSNTHYGNNIIYSFDGVNWIVANSTQFSGYYSNIVNMLVPNEVNKYWAVILKTATSTYRIFTSIDGVTWKDFSASSLNNTDAIWIVGDTLYVAISNATRAYGINPEDAALYGFERAFYYAPDVSGTDIFSNIVTPTFLDDTYYFRSGMATRDGINMFNVSGSPNRSASSYYDLFTDGAELYVKPSNITAPIKKFVPVAGTSFSYSEGSADQYMRIK